MVEMVLCMKDWELGEELEDAFEGLYLDDP
jgi:hypothetical protein